MKRSKAGCLALCLTFCYLVGDGRLAAEPRPPVEPPHELRFDAELSDVFFLDAENGWAVGDRGVIWHTNNGGAQWHLQSSGVGCRLESICFVDAHNGWAVGGWSTPYTHSSHGVMLRTADGGKTWTPSQKSILPRLIQIKMFGARGWALGQSSVVDGPAQYASGLLRTDDAGRSWKSVPTSGHGGWLAATFRNPLTATLIGPEGQVAMIRNGQFTRQRKLNTSLHSARAVAFGKADHVLFAGDGGLLADSTDGGRSWNDIEANLPQGINTNFDFKAIATHGDDIWLAGSPGTVVLHSSNAGRSWSLGQTGQNLPIHDLTFVDRHRGWAVGSLGNILATRDGGRSWQRQRSGGTRVGLLAVFSRPTDVPLELLVRLAGNDARLCVAEFINCLDSSAPEAAGINDNTAWLTRSQQALTTAGASGANIAWQFPLGRYATSSKALQKHLVRRIRMWQPEVIVTHMPHPAADHAAAHRINQAVLHAVGKAATDRDLGTLGLRPWKVKKIFTSLGPGRSGTIDLISSKLAPRLATTLGQRAALARSLLVDRPQEAVERYGFRLALDQSPGLGASNDFFDQRHSTNNDPARRKVGPFQGPGLAALKRTASARHKVQAVLSHAEQATSESIRQVFRRIQNLERPTACEILLELADGFHRRGRWDLAVVVYETMTRQYADQPCTEYALQWLIYYTASGEAKHLAAMRRAASGGGYSVRQTSGAGPSDKTDSKPQRLNDHSPRPMLAARLATAIRQTCPLLAEEPSIQLPLAAAFLKSGQEDRAQQLYQALAARQRHDIWWRCARNQQWHVSGRPRPVDPLEKCEKTSSKPFLDGKLDDDVWRDREPLRLLHRIADKRASPQKPAVPELSPALVKLARDDEFLYVAIRCPKASGIAYIRPKPGTTRQQDADLVAHDRVELLIDIDCDFATYYRLVVDHRGWTTDSCWGDSSWNPKWFVASQSTETEWTAELAIPWASLSTDKPKIWAVGIQRQIPGVAFQSWKPYASPAGLPQGFGLVQFQD